MKINKENALRLWELIYGSRDLVQDCFGTYMYKYDFGDSATKRVWKNDGKLYNFGWEIDHILPTSKGGTDDNNNLEPMHWQNNQEKSDKTIFYIQDKQYEIYRCKLTVDGYKGYGIIDRSNRTRIDWKYKYSKHF